MTPSEFTRALDTIGWSFRTLGARLGCDHHLPMRWARGGTIPASVVKWLRLLAQTHESLPAPEWWGTSDWRDGR
jgi:hypothetical protein